METMKLKQLKGTKGKQNENQFIQIDSIFITLIVWIQFIIADMRLRMDNNFQKYTEPIHITIKSQQNEIDCIPFHSFPFSHFCVVDFFFLHANERKEKRKNSHRKYSFYTFATGSKLCK